MKFRRWQEWDVQRVGGKFHKEYVDYATVAIGLYAAAAGIPEKVTLAIENSYARRENYGKKTKFDATYTNPPETNVSNTKLGYQLFQTGQIGKDDQ